jgi:hypothetical protein
MGTANNPQTGVSDSDFASVTDTDTDFLHVASGSTKLKDLGTTGTYATVDIAGTTRSPTWDIGAHELGTNTVGPQIMMLI